MQQLQVRENIVVLEKELGAVKVIKDQIQCRPQSLFNLARGYVSQIWVFGIILERCSILKLFGTAKL